MAEPDRSLLAQFESMTAARRAQVGVESGGRGPYDPGMEARIVALEGDVKEIKGDVKRLAIDMAEIKGRLSQMPTTVQLVTLVFSIFGAAIALLGGVFAVLRFSGHS